MKNERTKMKHLLLQKLIALTTVIFTMIILSFALTPNGSERAFAAPPVVADACLNDLGTPVIPRVPVPGARALALNFNHPLAWFETEACLATRDPKSDPAFDPEEYKGVIVDGIGYEVVYCDIVGNTGPIGIGNGSARFADGSHVSCPSEFLATGANIHKFYVFAQATFHNTGPAYFTLADHPDFEVKANVNANWHVQLKSRYGINGAYFSNRNLVANVQNALVPLFSRIRGDYGSMTKGAHQINGDWQLPSVDVESFSIVDDAPIIIGQSSAGYAWNIDFIVIDPPNGYH